MRAQEDWKIGLDLHNIGLDLHNIKIASKMQVKGSIYLLSHIKDNKIAKCNNCIQKLVFCFLFFFFFFFQVVCVRKN